VVRVTSIASLHGTHNCTSDEGLFEVGRKSGAPLLLRTDLCAREDENLRIMLQGRSRKSMPIGNPLPARPVINRRNFLYAATAAVGAAGLVAAAWPLIDQMNPDAQVLAAGDVVEVNLVDLLPAQQRLVRWRRFPIFVVRRTPAMLDAMQERAFVAQLFDRDSQKHQQPAYAKNWHRSIDPAFAVLVGLCTECGCVPRYFADASVFNVAGGYVCPCCNSHYDPAGRAYAGIASCNLPVPPYEMIGQSRILLGRNAQDEFFSLEQVERV